jgi:hypothetical protein
MVEFELPSIELHESTALSTNGLWMPGKGGYPQWRRTGANRRRRTRRGQPEVQRRAGTRPSRSSIRAAVPGYPAILQSAVDCQKQFIEYRRSHNGL